MRGCKVGRALARSFLYHGPALGYRGSVFNLVYANNTASIRYATRFSTYIIRLADSSYVWRLWDNLGFTRVGLIPKAGRLKSQDREGEEFVDALVFYKSFEP